MCSPLSPRLTDRIFHANIYPTSNPLPPGVVSRNVSTSQAAIKRAVPPSSAIPATTVPTSAGTSTVSTTTSLRLGVSVLKRSIRQRVWIGRLRREETDKRGLAGFCDVGIGDVDSGFRLLEGFSWIFT